MDTKQRQSLYWLMIVIAAGFMTARIANVENVYDPSVYKTYNRAWPKETPSAWPTFASNDRARWATVKALVEEKTFVIGKREPLEAHSDISKNLVSEAAKALGKGKFTPEPEPTYRDVGILFQDGFKSVDVVLHPERQEFFATKPPLLTLLATGEYWLLHQYLKWNISEQRWEVVVTILLTLNVLPLVIVLLLFSRLVEEYGTTDWGRLFTMAAACFGTFLPTFTIALSNHIPASCCVFFAMYLLLRGEGLLAAIGAGLFSGMAVCLDLPSASFTALGALLLFGRSWVHVGVFSVAAVLPMALQTLVNHHALGTWLPVYAQFGGPWYEYPGSHWAKRHLIPKPYGIDFIDEPKHVYAFHLLFGHHGLFSLSPIWLLAFVKVVAKPTGPRIGMLLRRLTPLVALVVIVFYIFKTNNYGGWTCGPRWLFWLTPLFLLCLIPAADRLSTSRLGRSVACICLAVSAFSAMYPWANPWRHPWIHQWCKYMGWIDY